MGETCFVLSVSSTQLADVSTTAVPEKTILHIRDSKVEELSVQGPDGEKLSYQCVNVTDPDNVSVAGGGPLSIPSLIKKEETDQSAGYYTQLPPDHDGMPLEVKGRVIRALLPG